jgi:peptidoglycan-associated lipoprotein
LQVVSYGEEKPAVDGHDESAYQLNRRVELLYQGQ